MYIAIVTYNAVILVVTLMADPFLVRSPNTHKYDCKHSVYKKPKLSNLFHQGGICWKRAFLTRLQLGCFDCDVLLAQLLHN